MLKTHKSRNETLPSAEINTLVSTLTSEEIDRQAERDGECTKRSGGETLTARRPSMDIARLSIVDILSSIPREDLASIGQQCNWGTYRKGKQILYQDDPSTDVVFLCGGRARATVYSPAGKEISYEELSEGAVFGEIAALDGQRRSTHVVAATDCVIATMTADLFVELIRKYPDVGIEVSRRLCSTVRFLCTRIFEFSALSVNDRIEAELLRVARERGFDGDTAMIQRPPTHAEIASRVNTHREAVTKHLNEMDRAGLIERQGRTLVIPNIVELESRVRSALEE